MELTMNIENWKKWLRLNDFLLDGFLNTISVIV